MTVPLYAPLDALPHGVPLAPILYPFYGRPEEDERDPARGRFDRWVAAGGNLYRLSSLQEARVAVLPAPWEHIAASRPAVGAARALAEQPERAGKPLLVFNNSDDAGPIPLVNTIVYRTSLFASRRQENERALPAWSEDFAERYLGGDLRVSRITPNPVVGFMGLATPPRRTLRSRIRSSHPSIFDAEYGQLVRSLAIRLLEADPAVQTRFEVNSLFHGGSTRADGTANYELMGRTRRAFVQNMTESQYILCVRGAGNFSYRLYETLSCGRIPLFVNTDCVLPFQDRIDWNSYCVWMEDDRLDSIARDLRRFHASLGQAALAEHQRRCRRLWEDWLSPLEFFTRLPEELP